MWQAKLGERHLRLEKAAYWMQKEAMPCMLGLMHRYVWASMADSPQKTNFNTTFRKNLAFFINTGANSDPISVTDAHLPTSLPSAFGIAVPMTCRSL